MNDSAPPSQSARSEQAGAECYAIEVDEDSKRPPSPPRVMLSYHSTAGHESISTPQQAVDPDHPDNQMRDDEEDCHDRSEHATDAEHQQHLTPPALQQSRMLD
jgi:hypothetical protein